MLRNRNFIPARELVCPITKNNESVSIPYNNWKKQTKLTITHRSFSTNIEKYLENIKKVDPLNKKPATKIEKNILYKERNKPNLIQLNNNNYYEHVLDPENNVIIFYYLDNCVHCKKIFTILNKIKASYPHFKITTLDYNKYPINHLNLKITHVPTVVLLQKQNKANPIVFKTNYTFSNYLTFFKNYWI